MEFVHARVPPPSLVPPKLELDGVLVIWFVGDMVLMGTSVVLALAACWIWHVRYREVEEKQQLLDPALKYSRSDVAAETALVNAAAPVRVHHMIPLGQLHGPRFMLDLEAADASATDTDGTISRGAISRRVDLPSRDGRPPVDEYRSPISSVVSSVNSPHTACNSMSTNMATDGPGGAATSPPHVLLHKLSSHLAQSLATAQLACPPGLIRQVTPYTARDDALRCIPLDGRIRFFEQWRNNGRITIYSQGELCEVVRAYRKSINQ